MGRVTVNNPGDAGATVTLTRNAADGVSYGRLSPYMRFDGVTGQMQENLDELSPTVRTAGVITGLHLGLFAAPVLRWFYFLVSLAGTGMVGTGLVLWIAKRRQKARPGAREAFSLRLVDGERRHGGRPVHRRRRLLLGQPPAAARPAGTPALGSARFFSAWGLSLVYAFLFQRRKWLDLLAVAAASLALVPVISRVDHPAPSGGLAAGRRLGDGRIRPDLPGRCVAAGLMARKAARARKAPAGRPAARPAPSPNLPQPLENRGQP